jgi:transposase-like protein
MLGVLSWDSSAVISEVNERLSMNRTTFAKWHKEWQESAKAAYKKAFVKTQDLEKSLYNETPK